MEAVYPTQKEGIRADSPADAPPGINFYFTTPFTGGVAVAPKNTSDIGSKEAGAWRRGALVADVARAAVAQIEYMGHNQA
jgi:hypothetical protein